MKLWAIAIIVLAYLFTGGMFVGAASALWRESDFWNSLDNAPVLTALFWPLILIYVLLMIPVIIAGNITQWIIMGIRGYK